MTNFEHMLTMCFHVKRMTKIQRMTWMILLTCATHVEIRYTAQGAMKNARVHTGHSAETAMMRYTDVQELPLFAKMFHFHWR